MLTSDQGKYIDVEGLRTFHIKEGSGTLLLLLYGGSPGGGRPALGSFGGIEFSEKHQGGNYYDGCGRIKG